MPRNRNNNVTGKVPGNIHRKTHDSRVAIIEHPETRSRSRSKVKATITKQQKRARSMSPVKSTGKQIKSASGSNAKCRKIIPKKTSTKKQVKNVNNHRNIQNNDGIEIEISVNEQEMESLLQDYESDSELDYDDVVEENNSQDDTANSEVVIGESAVNDSGSKYQEKRLRRDNKIRALVNQLLEEKLKSVGQIQANNGTTGRKTIETPVQKKINEQRPIRLSNQVKSPSDTTLYSPALCRQVEKDKVSVSNYAVEKEANQQTESVIMIEKIVNFVDAMRLEHERGESGTRAGQGQHRGQTIIQGDEDSPVEPSTSRRQSSVVNIPGLDRARERVEDKIIQAEKFKANVAEPPGTSQFCKITHLDDVNTEFMLEERARVGGAMGYGKSDDNFYHMTCHLDNGLIKKIEQGDYVDLERLLPKVRNKIQQGNIDNGNLLQWVQSDEGIF